jgi:YD repeat-containing protein
MVDNVDVLPSLPYDEQLVISEQAFMSDCRRLYDGKEEAFNLRTDITHITSPDGETHAPTYHNWDHITAAYTCTDDFLTDFRDGIDPCNLAQQLVNYKELLGDEYVQNKELWDRFFTGPEFALTWRLMWAGHDLGNLTDSDSFDEDGSVPFHRDYLIKGAEARSQDLTDQLIEKHFANHDMKDMMKKFARHLIEQTIYIPNEDKETVERKAAIPFHNFVQLIDQVGSGFYNKNKYANIVAGLVNEFQGSNEQYPLTQTPYAFAHFPFTREQQMYASLDDVRPGRGEFYYQGIMSYLRNKRPKKYAEIEQLSEVIPQDLGNIDYSRDVLLFAHLASREE